MVSGSRMLRIFGRKREELAGGWRRPHDEELDQVLLGRLSGGGWDGWGM